MAGHSKFKNIMHRKGAQDKKRAKAFSRLGKEIFVAVKSGGPDPETNIRFQLSAAAKVSLKIFDLHGQNIVTLSNGFRQAGSYNVMWDGKNAYGKSVASGVYFYRLSYFGESGEQSLFARKMLLLR